MTEELSVLIMETFSLLFVVASFLVFTVLILRVKTTRSLQFQLWVFSFVLLISELPRIFETLGLIDIEPLELLGLEIHTISMFAFGLFVAYRAYRFLGM